MILEIFYKYFRYCGRYDRRRVRGRRRWYRKRSQRDGRRHEEYQSGANDDEEPYNRLEPGGRLRRRCCKGRWWRRGWTQGDEEEAGDEEDVEEDEEDVKVCEDFKWRNSWFKEALHVDMICDECLNFLLNIFSVYLMFFLFQKNALNATYFDI